MKQVVAKASGTGTTRKQPAGRLIPQRYENGEMRAVRYEMQRVGYDHAIERAIFEGS